MPSPESFNSGWNACLDQCTKAREGEESTKDLLLKERATAIELQLKRIAELEGEKGLEALDKTALDNFLSELAWREYSDGMIQTTFHISDKNDRNKLITAIVARFGTRKDGRHAVSYFDLEDQ